VSALSGDAIDPRRPIQAGDLGRDLVREYKVPSGAGHGARFLSTIAPAGMLFIPSRRGISHGPDEWSDAEDIALGAVVLASAVARIDQQEWLTQ
jgi:acetylornithine deacetylase/succinyl-diaminopimelate desuccinylase-like protein